MLLPNLSSPVIRNSNQRFVLNAINPSGIACRLCHTACNAMAQGLPRDMCNIACDKSPAC